MRIRFGGRHTIAISLLLALSATPAPAIIRVDVPLGQVYGSAKQILVAKVASVDIGANVAKLNEVVGLDELSTHLKVKDRTLSLDLSGDSSLARRLRQGAPVVIFVGRRGGAIHAAGGWFQTSPRTAATDWKTVKPYKLAQTFPGTTPSLIRALMLIRAGESPILDKVMHHTWHGEFKLQQLPVTASEMAAADANGDGKADLLIITDKGVRFYQGSGPKQAFTEATDSSGLGGVPARQAFYADVNGDTKPDLLLDALYLNNGSRFVRSQAGVDLRRQDVLAVGLMDVTGDGQPEALVLQRDGTVTVSRNPGKDVAWARLLQKRIWTNGDPPLAAHFGAWGEGKTPHVMVVRESGLTRYSLSGEAADLNRLIGFTPMNQGKPRHFPMPDFLASAAWDRNGGDGHLDLLVASKRGRPVDLEIIGRGHGAFFWNIEGRVSWRPLRDTVAMTGADMYGDGSQELLLLERDGTLWQKDSPVHVGGKPIGE